MDLTWLQQLNVEVDANSCPVLFREILALLSGLTARTFHRVAIDQSADGWTQLGAKAAGKTWKLHYLVVTGSPGGSCQVVSNDADDGTGTDEDLTGDMPIGANGGAPIGPLYAPDFCPTGTTGEALGIRTTTAQVRGFAVISTD